MTNFYHNNVVNYSKSVEHNHNNIQLYKLQNNKNVKTWKYILSQLTSELQWSARIEVELLVADAQVCLEKQPI